MLTGLCCAGLTILGGQALKVCSPPRLRLFKRFQAATWPCSARLLLPAQGIYDFYGTNDNMKLARCPRLAARSD